MKINKLNNNSQHFGTISRDAKRVLYSTGVRTVLEREYGINGKILRSLDESKLKFELLSETTNEIPELSGLFMIPPKELELEKLPIVAKDIKTPTNASFAKVVSIAVEMERAYSQAVKKLNIHGIKRTLTLEQGKGESGIRRSLAAYTTRARDRDKQFALQEIDENIFEQESRCSKIRKFASGNISKARRTISNTLSSKWNELLNLSI